MPKQTAGHRLPRAAYRSRRGARHARYERGLRGLDNAREIRRFLLVSLIDSLGTGLFLAGSALFFTRTLGLSTTEVGLGLSLAGVAGFLGSMPLGRAADRFGGKRLLIGIQLWRAGCFAAYPFVNGLPAFIVVACLIGVAEWAARPIIQALVGELAGGDDTRVRAMAAMSAVRNAGFTVGALLATITITTEDARQYATLIFADAASFVLAALLLVGLRVAATPSPRAGARSGSRLPDARFLWLTAMNGVLYLHTVLLSIGLPLWVANHTAAPPALVGAIVVVNTVLAILLPMRLSRGAEDVAGACVRQRRAGWCLAACCLLVSASGLVGTPVAVGLILAAAVALTVGEVWQSTGAWGLSYALSPPDRRAYYLSVYNLGPTGASVVGPGLLTVAVVEQGTPGWLGLAAMFVLAGLAVPIIARRAAPPRPTPHPRTPHPRPTPFPRAAARSGSTPPEQRENDGDDRAAARRSWSDGVAVPGGGRATGHRGPGGGDRVPVRAGARPGRGAADLPR